jgi:hypothetical protein
LQLLSLPRHAKTLCLVTILMPVPFSIHSLDKL